MKCWAPAASSSWFCFRVINVPLNSARPWAPVSLAFNAISQAGGGAALPATPITGGRGGWSPPAAPHSAMDKNPPRATSPCILIDAAVPETAAHRPRSRRPSFFSPLPARASRAPELDAFPLRSQTSPSPRPLTEQSFIKLFHALSGRGAPGDGGLFRPFVEAPQDRPA